jgi:hypothetical protein
MFFPEFRKIDFLDGYYVRDVAIGSQVVHALCE